MRYNSDISGANYFDATVQHSMVYLKGIIYPENNATGKIGTLSSEYIPKVPVNVTCPFMNFSNSDNEGNYTTPCELKNILIYTDGSVYVMKNGYFIQGSDEESLLEARIDNNPERGYYYLENISFNKSQFSA